jgi:serpin B
MALLMTYGGAKGETAEAMQRTLRLAGLDPAGAALAVRAYLDDIKRNSGAVRLSIANSIWHRPEIVCLPAFLKHARDTMQSGVHKLDFTKKGAADRINSWIAGKTDEMITKVLDSIPGNAVMYLINAIYFHGTWKTAFEKAQTQPEVFTKEGGGAQTVPMMRQSGTFGYHADARGEVVELPYGDGRFAMLAMLPKKGSSMRNYLATLDWAALTRLREEMSQRKGEVRIPRFSISWGVTDLVTQLRAMGMGLAFGAGADFSGITGARNLAIDKVLHKAVIEVDEKGTKAAAVTVVGVKMTSFTPGDRVPPFRFIADRPFAFVIIDTRTGMPLFTGVMHTPS